MHTEATFEHGWVQNKREWRCVGAGSYMTFFSARFRKQGYKVGIYTMQLNAGFTQIIATWEEGACTEELPPADWPVANVTLY